MQVLDKLIILWLQHGHLIASVTSQHNYGCKPGFEDSFMSYKRKKMLGHAGVRNQTISCVNNMALDFPCKNIDLESIVTLKELSGGNALDANDLWGWTNPRTRVEYAIVGLASGTSYVDLSNPNDPIVLGTLRTHTFTSEWRDVKTFKNHAFIVSEAIDHGMQILDLMQLSNVSLFSRFEETYHYDGVGNAHNIFINENSGYAFIVGSKKCMGGLHIVDVNDPLNPTFAGCYSTQGYIHDVQCISYDGPDLRFLGREICFASNENKLIIVDVTNKSFPKLISTFSYNNYGYVHQGWLTDDRNFFLIDDEMDEFRRSTNTKTFVVSVSDLHNPFLKSSYISSSRAIDHNQYIMGSYAYQANYRAGLRIIDLSSISTGVLNEVAYFDVFPKNDDSEFNGAWSNFPFFNSGIVIVSSIEQGLFVLRPFALKKKKHSNSIYISEFTILPMIASDTWSATLHISLQDQINKTVEGAVVTVRDDKDKFEESCVSDTNGHCVLYSSNLNFTGFINFTVSNITKLGYHYNAAKNNFSSLYINIASRPLEYPSTSQAPTSDPNSLPSYEPTNFPSKKVSDNPSTHPWQDPTSQPSHDPSLNPSTLSQLPTSSKLPTMTQTSIILDLIVSWSQERLLLGGVLLFGVLTLIGAIS